MHYNARYYDPAIGRFISADTIIPNPTNPQDLNRYSYVRNNPINYTDPSGHLPCMGSAAACDEFLSHDDPGSLLDGPDRDSTVTGLIGDLLNDAIGSALSSTSSVTFAGAGGAQYIASAGERVYTTKSGITKYRPLSDGLTKRARTLIYGRSGADAMTRAARARGLSKWLNVASVAIDAHESLDLYEDKSTGIRVAHTVGRSSLSLAGALTGADLGAKAGFVGGNAVCGPLCGGVGAIGLGAGGAIAGSGLAKSVWD